MKRTLILALVGLMSAALCSRAEAQLLYANSTDTFLHLIDLSDGSSQQLFDIGDGPTGLAVDDANGIIYWTEGTNLNTTTYAGVTSTVGAFGPGLTGGLAFDSVNGVLYATSNGPTLTTIDTTTGAATVVGTLTDPVAGGILTLGGLAYDPLTNQLLASNDGTDDGLYSIDPTALTVSLITNANHDGDVDGLAAGNGIAYLVNDNITPGDEFFAIDIATGTLVDSGDLVYNVAGAFAGGAFAPGLLTAIPEPGTLGFLAIGAAAAMFRRRR